MPEDAPVIRARRRVALGGCSGTRRTSESLGIRPPLDCMPMITELDAMVVGGSYAAVVGNGFGIDPLVAGLLWAAPFYVLGLVVYEFYRRCFENRGRGGIMQSLTLFFGNLWHRTSFRKYVNKKD